jgi:hypothetical protein
MNEIHVYSKTTCQYVTTFRKGIKKYMPYKGTQGRPWN